MNWGGGLDNGARGNVLCERVTWFNFSTYMNNNVHILMALLLPTLERACASVAREGKHTVESKRIRRSWSHCGLTSSSKDRLVSWGLPA
ncbi:hypothetical protein OIU85_005441 [Salix viminalis]|uniref:Uncharacterized protein n=1 Tax=Salix viminalis TaxID=40686 RepID=A0A9Q0ST29_SALVM|nr:hypothetical protein OIU85_005441 [Salix viminalis]